jgi:Mn2+/Fe2+ NRAMP family transporter
MMLLLVICNFGNVVAEFGGISTSMELFGLSKYVSVPVAAAFVWLIVVKGNYKSVEKIFLLASVFYVAYIAAGILAHPNWGESLRSVVHPPSRSDLRNSTYVYMVIGLVGTTIAPWMQFYLQSSIVEKGVTARQYSASRIDVVVGSIFTDVVAWFIIVACAATLYTSGFRDVHSAAEAAQGLRPLAGQYAFILFGAGLFNASLFAASILPLSTAYTVCEGLGFESGVGKKFSEAPVFYWLYTALIILGAAVILIPKFPVVKVIVLSQVLNGMLLPFVLVFMLLLVNKYDLMGKYVNSVLLNAITWITAIVVVLLTIASLFTS